MSPEAPDRYLLTSSLESTERGDTWQKGEQLPLHVTVMPWFEGVSVRALSNFLHNTCHDYPPIEVVGGEEMTFGDNDEVIEVNKLRRAAELPNLHREILGRIYTMGGIVHSPHIGDGYTPHVSQVGGMGLDDGETACLDTLELVRKHQGAKQVEDVIRFSGPEDT